MPPGMKVKIASGLAAAIRASSAEKSSWPSGVDLVDDLALETLEAGDRVLARLIVRHHDEHPLVALILGVFAHHLVVLVVLVGGGEEIRGAELAGDW